MSNAQLTWITLASSFQAMNERGQEFTSERLVRIVEAVHAEFLETIEQSCDRLLALVNDLLDMAKVESGRIDL